MQRSTWATDRITNSSRIPSCETIVDGPVYIVIQRRQPARQPKQKGRHAEATKNVAQYVKLSPAGIVFMLHVADGLW